MYPVDLFLVLVPGFIHRALTQPRLGSSAESYRNLLSTMTFLFSLVPRLSTLSGFSCLRAALHKCCRTSTVSEPFLPIPSSAH